MFKIPFNKPFIIGNELDYIRDAINKGQLAGNGYYTKKCQEFFKVRYGFRHCLLTTSCTDALEMAAILSDVSDGDEVIMPSYTFVSTANAFVLRGAKIVFADSSPNHPNIDLDRVEELINEKTRVLVIVHYAGVACDMDKAQDLAQKYHLILIEDAAQAIDSYYNGKPLGSFGHFATFSFHETKNISSGEGGLLVVNDDRYVKRSEIIWEKGTNRAEFFRGEVNKYGWVDVGSSYLPSELTAAFLFAQLEHLNEIQRKRKELWMYYYENLKHLEKKGLVQLPYIHSKATNNAHMFYLLFLSERQRDEVMNYLKQKDILAVFHYLPLHLSPFYELKHDGRKLTNAEKFSHCLLRLPLYYELNKNQQDIIINEICECISRIS